MFNLTKEEERILKKLDTPVKIQDFIDNLKMNFEYNGETCMSPRRVLREKTAHCIEGAMLAALAFRFHGKKPLILDLTGTKDDWDHVIAVFQENGKWGAISQTNHAVLKYREPVYRDIRELVMSFFHEYTNPKGKKTLRSYSNPVNLARFDKKKWMTDEEELWYIDTYLRKVKHYKILTRKQIKRLRLQDAVEIKAGNIVKEKE